MKKQPWLKKSFLFMMMLMVVSLGAMAQNRVITGSVLEQETGDPIKGASVMIKGAGVGDTTNAQGKFSLQVPGTAKTLVISYVGYQTLEVALTPSNVYDIRMAVDLSSLDDVVVIGYGTQKRSQMTGSVATIKAADIEDIPASNVAGALRGRIAGVSVSANSGRPGSSISLNIRNAAVSDQAALLGVTSEPLYVVDGITVTKDAFDNIDPSMIEDLTILKDASAAIYGAAGAKGVVLVTTKRGKSGKPKLSYNGYVGISDATRTPDMLNAYDHALLLNDAYRISGYNQSLFFSAEDLEYLKGVNYKSWFDQIWKPAVLQRHNMNFSGGSDRITFFAGGSFQNENGNYAGIKQDKYGFRTGVVADIARGFKADINFNVDYRLRNSRNPTSQNDQSFLEGIFQMPRWVPMEVDGMYVNFNNSNQHPIGATESGFYNDSKYTGYRINTSLSYSFPGILDGLSARFQISQGGTNTSGEAYRPSYRVYNFKRFGNNNQLYSTELDENNPYTEAVAPGNMYYDPSYDKSNSYQGFLTLQYKKEIKDHSINVLFGGEQSRNRGEGLSVRWSNQLLPGLDDYWAFDQSLLQLRSRSITESVKRSFFGRLNYNYDDKYSLDVVTRLDASSNFVSDNIWGVFPSVGLGWVVSREDFFRNRFNFINYLKLRFSFGIVGDDRVDQRLWQERYTIDVSGYLYNESLAAGLNPQRIPNPDITWEKKRTINGGVDIAMFRDKLSLTMDFFQNFSYDGFDKGVDQAFPMFAGFQAPVLNYMERYNWGSEFTIGYRTKLAKDLSFNANMNFGFGNSVITKMYYNPFQLFENSPPDWQVDFGTDPRKYNNSNYGLRSIGMFKTQDEVDAFLAKNPNYTIDSKVPQPGWLYFEDTNGDGKITDRDMVPMFDRTQARFATGIQLKFTYKSLSLSTNIVARIGGKVFYDSKATERPEPTVNVPVFWKDRWTPENPNGRFPRFDDASIVRGWESDFWAVDGTMVRVNDMTLSFRIPDNISRRVGMSDARILLTGNNLWVLKNPLKYKDPYSSYIFDYPTIRTISAGISLGF